MRRKVFDELASAGGALIVIVLALAGALFWLATTSPTPTCTASWLSSRSPSQPRQLLPIRWPGARSHPR